MNRVDAVRRFNRFYTRHVGALGPGMVGTPFPLPEARVIYELGHGEALTATALCKALDLDAGYLSRLLQGLRRKGLLRGERSREDGRQTLLSLTPKGAKTVAELDGRTRAEVSSMLGRLSDEGGSRLVAAMRSVEDLLGQKTEKIVLREHRPGDMGWVVERHAALYYEQDGWGAAFEALIAEIVRDFLKNFDPGWEHCWIAERDGERLGCVFVVRESKTVAKLRLLIVDPAARGTGLGRRLVEACIAFAREKGYKKLVLWTHAHLTAARAIYKKTGFKKLPKTEVHDTFGPKAVSEFWELKL